jgi:hypothetical protein
MGSFKHYPRSFIFSVDLAQFKTNPLLLRAISEYTKMA